MSERIVICFVCHGNICRSPMAEFIMKQIVREAGIDESFHIFSRATRNDQIGKDTYPPAKTKLDEKGIPYGHRAAMRFSADDYDKSDIVAAMDGHNVRDLVKMTSGDPERKIHLLMEYTGHHRDVSDPWVTRDFEKAYRDIESGCEALFRSILAMKVL